jgi:sulfur relay (sulfurtransferase) complex TusBCD TusD component (DsrE family)
MRSLIMWLVCLALTTGVVVGPVFAGDQDPLFINLTTDDPHRASMGIIFGKNQLERGHPLTIFLNDRGVFVGSKAHATRFGEHQATLAALLEKGAQVLVCPMCMKHYGVSDVELIPGAQVGNPELTGNALFQDGAQSLTW